MDLVHQMLTRFYESAVYDVLYTYPDLQAYRKGRFTGWIRQPEKTGPVLFSNTSPTYARLKPVAASAAGGGGDDGGGGSGGLIAIIVSRWRCSAARRVRGRCAGAPPTSASERPLRHRQGPRLAGDARLRRRLQLLPVPRRRGRPGRQPLPRAQPQPEPARRADQAVRPRRLDRRAVRALRGADGAAQPRALVLPTTSPSPSEIWRKAGPTIALVGISTLLSTVFGVMLGIAAGWRRRTKTDYSVTTFTMATYAMPDFWLGMLLLTGFAVGLGWFPVGRHRRPQLRRDGPGEARRPGPAHVPAGAHADARLPRRVRARHALLAAGDDARGLPRARARQGPARRPRAQPPRGAQRAAAGGHADRHQLRLRALRARSRWRRSSPGRASAWRPTTRCRARTCRCSRACSSSSAPRSSSPTCSPTCSTATSIRGCATRVSAVAAPLGPPDHLAAPAARARRRVARVPPPHARDGRTGDPRRRGGDGARRAAAGRRRRAARGQHDRQPGVGQPVEVRPARDRPPRAQRHDAVHLGRAHQPARRPGRDRAGHGHRLGRRDRRGLLRRLAPRRCSCA